jgi:predicted urease superfamily metal-dependent hydrolase
MAKSKRLLITLSPTAFEALQNLADEKGISKSLVIEQYLRKTKQRKEKGVRKCVIQSKEEDTRLKR